MSLSCLILYLFIGALQIRLYIPLRVTMIVQEKYRHLDHNFMGTSFQVFSFHLYVFPKTDLPEGPPVFFFSTFPFYKYLSPSLPGKAPLSPSQALLSCITSKERWYITPENQTVFDNSCSINKYSHNFKPWWLISSHQCDVTELRIRKR